MRPTPRVFPENRRVRYCGPSLRLRDIVRDSEPPLLRIDGALLNQSALARRAQSGDRATSGSPSAVSGLDCAHRRWSPVGSLQHKTESCGRGK